MNTKRLTRCALFAAMALIIYAVESLLPPFAPVPGFKLGLANTVTLAAVYILGPVDAFWILTVRIILGNIFTGQLMSMIYSLSGGILCYAVTVALKRFFTVQTMWALGIAGALAHISGQVACASLLFRSASFLYYGVYLCIFACISGTFTGICAQLMTKYIKPL
ncbi:MAG: Gx transporter family protein [Clostridia bacterium]|nr:Gx transporter family protein [Clostridia bacterium]